MTHPIAPACGTCPEDDVRPGGLSSCGSSPSVSPVPASIPDASAWRTDSPPFGSRPIWQYVFVQGETYHTGHTWSRAGWGTAAIRTNSAADGYAGYRRSDIERICRDNGIDFNLGPIIVGWLPMTPPALITEEDRPALMPCDDGEWAAQGMETRQGGNEVPSQSDDSPVRQDAPQHTPEQKP